MIPTSQCPAYDLCPPLAPPPCCEHEIRWSKPEGCLHRKATGLVVKMVTNSLSCVVFWGDRKSTVPVGDERIKACGVLNGFCTGWMRKIIERSQQQIHGNASSYNISKVIVSNAISIIQSSNLIKHTPKCWVEFHHLLCEKGSQLCFNPKKTS